MSIEIYNINKYFSKIKILNNISLNISSNQRVALLGPSGSGKTTLLRIIAGLEKQDSGEIKFDQKNVNLLNSRERKIGFVFQNYALFRHMTVLENITFGLKILPRKKRPSNFLINKKAKYLLEMVQLIHLENRYPSQLSGGQKQRVALARALVIEPKILLLDEPFGALDTPVRKELRRWLRKIYNELKFTSIFVTHDQEEAMEVADKIVVMNKGNIEQVGSPNDIWDYPKTKFVLQFLSEVNLFHGKISGSKFYFNSYNWSLKYKSCYQGKVEIFLRPWEIDVSLKKNTLTPLPVQIIEFNRKNNDNCWNLVVRPKDWGVNLIILTINSNLFFPIEGKILFIGLQQAKLYSNGILLNTTV